MSKKIALIVAHQGFQATEYSVTKNILLDEGFDVITASNEPEHQNGKDRIAIAHDGSSVHVDVWLDEVVVPEYIGIFLIGGPKAIQYLDNYKTYRIVQEAELLDEGVFGAICISPRILANAGVLNGRKVTGWDGDGELQHVLDGAGALYIKSGVVVDRNLITASGPAAAKDFAIAIGEAIKNLE